MCEHHPIDQNKTGRDIAIEIIANSLGADEAGRLVEKLIGYKYPLEIVQKGQLTQVLEAAEKQARENEALGVIIKSLQDQLENKSETGDFSLIVFNFCLECYKKNLEPMTIFSNLNTNFPNELGLESVEICGNSAQMRLPDGKYITFDENKEKWDIGNSLF